MASRRSTRIDNLFRHGRDKGFVTLDDLVYKSPVSQSNQDMDVLLTELAEDGIDVIGTGEHQRVRRVTAEHARQLRSQPADPVAIYMKQLKEVPLLSKEAEVDLAQRLESGRLEALLAALALNVPLEAIATATRRNRPSKSSLPDVVNDDPDASNDSASDKALQVFRATVEEIKTLDRQRRNINMHLTSSPNLPEAEAVGLLEDASNIYQQMLDAFCKIDYRETYLNLLFKQADDMGSRLDTCYEEIEGLESEAGMSSSELRRIVRLRRRQTPSLPLQSITTVEFQLPADDGLPIADREIGDKELADLLRLIRNAERRIRNIERKLSLRAPQIAKRHRELVDGQSKAQRAKDNLVLANQRLVVHISAKYLNRGLPFLELIQEGNLGLMRAVEKFDHRRGYKFSTYGTWWIRHAISRAIANQTRTIRLPVHVREAIRKLVKESRKHVLEMGNEPTTEQLAARLEVPVEKVVETIEASRKTLRWELPVGEEGDTELGTMIADTNVPSPFEEVSSKGQWAQIVKAMQALQAREQDVLRRRFGLEGHQAQTLEEVGKELGITRERVRQIQARAVRKLQVQIRSETEIRP